MGLFDGVGDAKLYENGVYLTPGGVYELEVKNILLKKTRKSGLGFIVEFKILSVEGSAAEDQHAPGSKATWFQKMADTEVAFPSIKRLFIAMLQIDEKDEVAMAEFNDEIDQLLEESTSWTPTNKNDEHPLAGYRVRVETYTKKTARGADFTAHVWSPSEWVA